MDNAHMTTLLDWTENELFGTPTGVDIAKHAPDLTAPDAYRLNAALVLRRVAQGDTHIGYKIASGASGIRAETAEPRQHVVGSLMRSGLFAGPDPVPFGTASKMVVEAEVAVLLKRDLQGPRLTMADVIGAVEGYFPAIEIVPSTGGPRGSHLSRIVSSKFTGGIVLGNALHAPHGIDLQLEGAIMRVNGEPMATATGVVIMGNPLTAVAAIANQLAEIGVGLKAGMVLMTGTFTGTTPVKPGDCVEAAFTRLGSATARFVA